MGGRIWRSLCKLIFRSGRIRLNVARSRCVTCVTRVTCVTCDTDVVRLKSA